jgi:hypothetical protein
MKERFVFLEITDPDVNALVAEIRSIVGGSPLMRPAHLTIRGPYARSVPHQVLSRCNAAMSHDVLSACHQEVIGNDLKPPLLG